MELNYYVEFIKKKHGAQTRKQGSPYYLHPLAVSKLLAKKGFSVDYQITGLFHDLLEDTDVTYEDLIAISSKKIADAVKLVTKEDGYEMTQYIERIQKNDMAKMVKLADRIHNLSESHLASQKFQEKYIKETEEWYTNLAKGTVFEEDLKNELAQLKVHYQKNKI